MTGGMMFKGTPGPWYVGDNGKEGPNPRYWIVTNEETWCDRVCSVPEYNEAKAVANANLIAAAPDLLEALKEAVEFCNAANNYIAGQYLPAASRWEAAIAKALGEQK